MSDTGTAPAKPVSIFPLVGQASQLSDDGKHDRAAQLLIDHLRRNPDEPAGLTMLGVVALRLGALGQAEHFLRRALDRGSTGLEVRRNLADVVSLQERPVEAIALLDALIAETGEVDLKGMRAGLFKKIGRHDEALAIDEELVTANPDRILLWVSYGHGLRAAGRVDEAIAAYRRAVALDPEFGDAWWGLASIKRTVLTNADIAAMRGSLRIAIDIRNSAPLHFALARAFHDRADYPAAFEHYEAGNRQRAESIGYDARELTAEVDEIERAVDAAFIQSMPAVPAREAVPIFVISLPRSGSTLLEQMLGSHPQVEPVGELPYIPALLRSYMEAATRRGRITVPQAIAGISDRDAAALGADYTRRAAVHRRTDRAWFVDKLPQNWSNVLFIRRILPQARFLDIRRPAMDCCFSNFTQSFTSAHASSFALRDVGQCYVDYVRAMEHFDRIAPGLIAHVDYSHLVEDPRSQLEPALAYLGLAWDDAVLGFHQLDRVVRTPSSEQVRRPLNRDGMEIWKPYSRWLDPLREVLGDLAEG